MKHLLTTTAAILLLLTTTAHADTWTSKTPEPPTAAEYSAATHSLVSSHIEAQGWCARKTPAPKSGQIIVYYTRDKSGRCVSAFKAGR